MDKHSIAIRVENVSKDFKLPHEKITSIKGLFTKGLKRKRTIETQHALRDISFEIEKGEFFGIVGRNGSGKSTLLKILAEIYQPTKGKVQVDGKLVPFIELGVGFNPELTGRENVYLNGALMGFSSREIDEMYDDIVSFAELEAFMDQKLKNYSSGMQVRLAFSVATRAKADILLIDEVLAVGDADFQRKCFDYFKQLKKDKKTVVFVSHDMDAVRTYCDKAVLIDANSIIAEGTAEAVSKEYTRLFLPDIEVDDVSAQEKAARGKWGDGSVEISNVKVSKKVIKEEDEFVEVFFKVTAKEDFDIGVVGGIQVKDQAGKVVCGTNSQILQEGDKLLLKRGDEVTFSWKIPHIFNEGVYTLEPSVIRASSANVCQWWDDAAAFRVVNDKTTPFLIAPKILLNVEKA